MHFNLQAVCRLRAAAQPTISRSERRSRWWGRVSVGATTHGRAGSVFDLGLRERSLPLVSERLPSSHHGHHRAPWPNHQHAIAKHESEQQCLGTGLRARSRLALSGMSSARVGPRLGTLERAAAALAADACWQATAWTGDVAIRRLTD